MSPHPAPGSTDTRHIPRLIAWEVTRSCMLACKHCRAAAQAKSYPDELRTEECFRLLDNIASFAKPIIILTGGEPMLRPDIYDIATHATNLGLRVVMAPCGALLDDESAARILQSGIRHISISLDGATEAEHDAFRGVDGAFAGSLRGIEAAKRAGLDFQINTTITQHNLHELPAILELAVQLGATVFNPFLLVPTGRGKQLADQEISPEDYEGVLGYMGTQQARTDIRIRVTCAPHYQRVIRQLGVHSQQAHPAKGCMGGQSFAFISHRGKVQICGFLDLDCGDVRAEDFNFEKIWRTSKIFLAMRDTESYHGRCGYCEFGRVCGGCRARAYAITGDYLDEEPFCTYQPKRSPRSPKPSGAGEASGPAELSELDERILSIIQTNFPVRPRPFDVLAQRLGSDTDEIIRRISRMHQMGVIRRLGAVFDSRSLGYASTLVATRIPTDRIAEVAKIISSLPGVTHNYQRQHAYNLWFTLTAESDQQIQSILDMLRRETGITEFHSLPALAVYKIRVDFQLGKRQGASVASEQSSALDRPECPADLSEDQKQLVRFLQEDLPLVLQPFDQVGKNLHWNPQRVIGQINEWINNGVIRRFGAVLAHRRLGFRANGMACFTIPEDKIDDIGRQLAKSPDISHCYHRPTLPDFPYNLFAMVHGRSEKQVRATVSDMAKELALKDYEVLFSTVEHKKTSMKYFVESPRA